MSEREPPDDNNDEIPPGDSRDPFAGIPFIGELLRSVNSAQDPKGPERQIAISIATGGRSEPNVDPLERIEWEKLARVAELQVAHRTGLDVSRGQTLSVEPVTRAVWAERSLEALNPLLAVLINSFKPDTTQLDTVDSFLGDTDSDWLQSLLSSIGPLLTGVMSGMLVGRLAVRNLGTYDLPIPREENSLLVIAPNVEDFRKEWSLPAEDLRLWVCIHEAIHHALLGVPHVRGTLTNLLARHAGAFQNDPEILNEHFENLDIIENPESIFELQGLISPEMVLGAVRSPEQAALLPHLESLVAVIIGYTDHIMDDIGARLITKYPMLTEALRRRRVTANEEDRFIERVFGLNLNQEQVDRGGSFITGVLERAGDHGLNRLWTSEHHLPTPNEVDAPGLWLARIDLNKD